MKPRTADTRSRPRAIRAALSCIFGTLSLVPAACGFSAPPPAEYVLGAAPAPRATISITGLPVVELRPVRLPDYLDTKDLLVRRDNLVTPSQTGRWGERLSVGVTRALAASLATRLADVAITTTPPVERPTLQILVDVNDFEATAKQEVVLVGTWTVTDGPGRAVLLAEQVALTEPVSGTGDSGVVAAMNRAVEDLASRVATGVEHALPRSLGSQ